MPTATFTIASTSKDIGVYKSGTTWANVDDGSTGTLTGDTVTVERVLSGNYYISIGAFEWDTSSLPEDAIITGAQLKIRVVGRQSVNTRNLTAEWYTGTVGLSAWTDNISQTAGGPWLIAGLSINYVTLTLNNPSANVSKSGTTKLRLHVDGTSAPTGYNYVHIAAYEHSSYNPAQLIVTYDLPTLPAPDAKTATNVEAESFTANWESVVNSYGHLLDVATQSNFTVSSRIIDGLQVGDVESYSVTGLTPGVTYYYRVRATNSGGIGGTNSNTITVTTDSTSVDKTITDSGSGLDALSGITKQQFKTINDTGAGTEDIDISTNLIRDFSIGDAGSALDTIILSNATEISIIDSGVGFESLGDTHDGIRNILARSQSSFEIGTVGVKELGDAIITIETADPYVGSQYLGIEASTQGSGFFLHPKIFIRSNEVYTFSCWIEADIVGSEDIQLTMFLYDTEDNLVTTATSTALPVQADWHFLQFSFMTATTATHVIPAITLASAGDSIFYIDAMELRRAEQNTETVAISANKDAFIVESNPNNNLGSVLEGAIGTSDIGSGNASRYLVQFDVSELSEDSLLIDSRIKLYQTDYTATGPGTLSVYRLLRDWGEGAGEDEAANTGEVTWNSSEDDEMLWGEPGADKI